MSWDRDYVPPQPLGWTPRDEFSVYMGPPAKRQPEDRGPCERVGHGVSSGQFLDGNLPKKIRDAVQAGAERKKRERRVTKERKLNDKAEKRRDELLSAITRSERPSTLKSLAMLGVRTNQTRHDIEVLKARGRVKTRVVTSPESAGMFAQIIPSDRDWETFQIIGN